MYILGRGKAKIRKTGEVVYVVSHNGEEDKRRKTDWVSYIDSKLEEHEMVKGLNLAWDFEEVTEKSDFEKTRAYESHLCVFSGMAMQAIMRSDSTALLNKSECVDYITELSIKYGIALCEKLDKIDLNELMNPKPDPEPEKKHDVAIGEVVEFQGERFLCEEKTDNEDCSGCAFLAEDCDCKFSGPCCKDNRKDGKNVIFRKLS